MISTDILPDKYHETLRSYHLLAAYVISGVRRRVENRIGLAHFPGGYCARISGPLERQVCVAKNYITDVKNIEDQENFQSIEITTLAASAKFLNTEIDREWAAPFDIPKIDEGDVNLPIDREAAQFIGDWFDFGYNLVLTAQQLAEQNNATKITLWPEHFDFAFEWGSEKDGTKASVGASPSDAHDGISEPYIYVSLWYPDNLAQEKRSSPLLNATTFTGAVMKLSDIAQIVSTMAPSGMPMDEGIVSSMYSAVAMQFFISIHSLMFS